MDEENVISDEALDHARAVWEESQRVQMLHLALADLYQTDSRDTRTIDVLWMRIEEGENNLRMMGVYIG